MKKNINKSEIYVGTSGWHYDHWLAIFYPAEIKGYYELRYHSEHFNTVENNSSFYRIAGENTYKTWTKMTPENYKFSMKLNKFITHIHRLELKDEVKEKINYILSTTQILGVRMGAIVIQLPPSLKYDLNKLKIFLNFFIKEIQKQTYKFNVAVEFRNKYWFNEDVYTILKKFNVALVTGQSSRYPEIRHVTSDIAYIRMHGPEKLFASKYTDEQLDELAKYVIKISKKIKKVYVYFNNDFHGYALENAKYLCTKLKIK